MIESKRVSFAMLQAAVSRYDLDLIAGVSIMRILIEKLHSDILLPALCLHLEFNLTLSVFLP